MASINFKLNGPKCSSRGCLISACSLWRLRCTLSIWRMKCCAHRPRRLSKCSPRGRSTPKAEEAPFLASFLPSSVWNWLSGVTLAVYVLCSRPIATCEPPRLPFFPPSPLPSFLPAELWETQVKGRKQYQILKVRARGARAAATKER